MRKIRVYESYFMRVFKGYNVKKSTGNLRAKLGWKCYLKDLYGHIRQEQERILPKGGFYDISGC